MADSTLPIRFAEPRDEAQLVALMPRLHAFPIHERRRSEDLWAGDAQLASRHLAGDAPQAFIYVVDASPDSATSTIAGLAMVSMQEEFMGHTPGSHLEAILVAEGYEGLGLGTRLLDAAEAEARARGAESMTLHVFNSNEPSGCPLSPPRFRI